MPRGVYPRKTVEQRFWDKVDKNGSNDCWLWRGPKRDGVYGAFSLGYMTVFAHRFSWELAHGPIPNGMKVLHHCDNPPCINPDHLFLGTIADNQRDMVNKKRQARGENSGHVKLTERQVREIRTKYVPYKYGSVKLAHEYGVNHRTIIQIIHRETWKEVV